MLPIIYSYNKCNFEHQYWSSEIAGASDQNYLFVPFNHGKYLDPIHYERAQKLDELYYLKSPAILRMYEDLQKQIYQQSAKILIVDNCFPYHPEFLKKLDIYKVIRTSDGPLCAYDRDFAYLHAYDHVFYSTPAYSPEINMAEKLRYCIGNQIKPINLIPLGSFDALCDPSKDESNILTSRRDIDVIFIGALHINKMESLAYIKKRLGSKLKFYGISSIKKNIYYNLKYGFPGWVTKASFDDYQSLYQRAKIGINIHNRNGFSYGNYRLFDLPANGVMQISDGAKDWPDTFFKDGKEIVGFRNTKDLLELIDFYLNNEVEREKIALAGFNKVKKTYQINSILREMAKILEPYIG